MPGALADTGPLPCKRAARRFSHANRSAPLSLVSVEQPIAEIYVSVVFAIIGIIRISRHICLNKGVMNDDQLPSDSNLSR